MKVVEYEPARAPAVADLMDRVWGKRPDERELHWLYEDNPVAPAAVLLAEEDGRVVASAAMTYARMSLGGAEVLAGMPVHLATDPAYRRRGIFAELQAANEERARQRGARALFVVPTESSASVLRGGLGWSDLPALRVWARPGLPGGRREYVAEPGDRVLRDEAWLDWRFRRAPRRYEVLKGHGYAVLGRRGRPGVIAASDGLLAPPSGPLGVAAPPPWATAAYLRAGWLPTPRTFTLLGKSLGAPLPARPHFELGDLDVF
ncbi:MAG: GNAT family N-acetyltransferase [Actinobacteria bacterium]|nr:GNAT family N-acetyltransferase [Actinomycetota bacterium]